MSLGMSRYFETERVIKGEECIEEEPSSINFRFNGSVSRNSLYGVIEEMGMIAEEVLLPEAFRNRQDVVRTVTYEGDPIIRYSVTDERRLKEGEGKIPGFENKGEIGREFQIVNGEIVDLRLVGNTEKITREFQIVNGEIVDFDLNAELKKFGEGC